MAVGPCTPGPGCSECDTHCQSGGCLPKLPFCHEMVVIPAQVCNLLVAKHDNSNYCPSSLRSLCCPWSSHCCLVLSPSLSLCLGILCFNFSFYFYLFLMYSVHTLLCWTIDCSLCVLYTLLSVTSVLALQWRMFEHIHSQSAVYG